MRCSTAGCKYAAAIAGLCAFHHGARLQGSKGPELVIPTLEPPARPAKPSPKPRRPKPPKPPKPAKPRKVKPKAQKPKVRKKPKPRRPKWDQPCKADGCGQVTIQAHGLCTTHYEVWLATAPERPRCSTPGCEEASRKRGMCSAHYRLERLADPTLPRCLEDGCEQTAMARGRCETHHAALRRAEKASRPVNASAMPC